jgi:gliding motility-associated lipoprotein GldJ
LGSAEILVENYLRHPAYRNYPVVGVSWLQANEYAKWRSDRVGEMVLQKEGYLERGAHIPTESVTATNNFNLDTYVNVPNQTFKDSLGTHLGGKGNRRNDTLVGFASRETGLIQIRYRLPTEAEWEYAALGLKGLREYNIYRGRKKYPWNGQYTRTGERKIKGDQLANFKQGKGDYGGIAGWSDDGADITNEVMSYDPNDFGVYDMAGNVAEWVADIYRPIVDDEFNDFAYYRGNIYTKNALAEDGSVKVFGIDDIEYDTLTNGKVIVKNLPGQLVKIPVDEDETYLRTNFNTSDNRNFRDGDKQSSKYFDDFEEGEALNADITRKMYDSPKHSIGVNSDGTLNREYDKSNTRTSLVNDQARVYKGGSWKDREYWLDPAQRRFYPEDMATDFIGFRCAMSRVGSKARDKKTKN